MRIVGKFNKNDITLESFHMSKTYGGWLLGPSKNRMEEANIGIFEDSKGRECERLFGEDRPTLIIGTEKFNLKELLPDVKAFAWLDCLSPVRGEDPSSYLSHLVVIWFQKKSDDPFEKLSELIKSVDWNAKAENVDYGSF